MAKVMDADILEKAFGLLGKRLGNIADVEILLVGGAAAIVTGLLGRQRTTLDCDVLYYSPPETWSTVEAAAREVAREMGLSLTWLNGDVQIRIEPAMLADGWRQRRILVGVYGVLHVFSASRPDLIALKFLAHRAVDLEDLRDMGITRDEGGFVRQYLRGITTRGEAAENVAQAMEVLEAWEFRP